MADASLPGFGLLQRSTELLHEIGAEFERAMGGVAYISINALCPKELTELYRVGLLLKSDEDEVLSSILIEVTLE